MKSLIVAVVVAALISLAANANVPIAGMSQDATDQGRLLLEHDVSMYGANRGPRDGAPGASAIGFHVNNAVQGTAIIVGLDRPALGVFIGINPPDESPNGPYQDLCVRFTLVDGSTRSVKAAGGGGAGILFHSPDDVPVSNLRMVALYVSDTAEWAK